MNDKSYVSMEQRVCQVCGKQYDTGALLMDTRLKNSLDMHTVTGWGLCEEHQKLFDDGYVALVEVTNPIGGGETMRNKDGIRTGKMAHLRRRIFNQLFNVELDDDKQVMVFVEDGIIDQLSKLMAQSCAN